MTHSIGFVGLGQMGMPIAGRLLVAGHRVLAFDQRDAARAQLEAAGGEWAASPRVIADRCSIVLVSLPTPEAVEAVVFGADGLAHGSELQVFVDLSTTGPQAAQKVAAGLAERGSHDDDESLFVK